jgi:hypothetical protein
VFLDTQRRKHVIYDPQTVEVNMILLPSILLTTPLTGIHPRNVETGGKINKLDRSVVHRVSEL